MKRIDYLLLAFLLSLNLFAQTKDEAVSNLRHQILDYPQEKLYLQMDRPQYEAGDTIWFRAHTVSEAFHLPSAMSRGIFVNLYGPDGKLVERFTLLPMDKRLYSSFIVLPEEMPEGTYRITAYSEQMQGKRSNAYFSKTFPIKNKIRRYTLPVQPKTPYVVHFYPEGGKLVDKHVCQIAFTVRDAQGNLVVARGSVYDRNGNVQTEFKTLQAGIGCFNLQVEAGKTYYALVQMPGSEPLYVDLPTVSPAGYSLKVVDMQDSYYISAQQAGADKLSHALKVLLLLRGVPEMTFQLTSEHDYLYIGKSELASGVHEIVLVDENDRVQSQRQIFVRNDDQVHVACTLLKDSVQPSPSKKKEVKLDLLLTDATGEPMTAEFSAALYPDTFAGAFADWKNIASEFLLNTDLNQHALPSGMLFEQPTTQNNVALDAWLMASRWPKFDIQRAMDGDFESSWDIGEKPEESFIRDSTGIYRPLSPEEKALRAKYRQIDLNEVNIYPEQLNKVIKPYPYVNHTVRGEELVTGGSTIQDYLVNLPGVAWDYAKGFLTIRNGSITYMLDGFNSNWDAISSLATTEIESVDVLKDPGNMGIFKFTPDSSQISNDEQMAIGGVVAVWTKRAIDVKPKANKKLVAGSNPVINDDVRRKLMSGTKDIWLSQFPNAIRANLWKPCLISDDTGKVQIRFTPKRGINRYWLEINGVGTKGQLLSERKLIELAEP